MMQRSMAKINYVQNGLWEGLWFSWIGVFGWFNGKIGFLRGLDN